MTKGERLRSFTKKIHKFCETHQDDKELAPFVNQLAKYNKEWGELVMKVGGSAMQNPDELGAASVDFLMYSGYVVLGYFWAQAAVTAHKALKTDTTDSNFYLAKIKTARFYFDRMLPKTRGYVATMNTGADNLMALEAEHFSF